MHIYNVSILPRPPTVCQSMPIYTIPNIPVPLNSLAVLGQLLLCALLTTLPDSPGELVGLGGIFVSRQDLGVLSSLNLVVSFASLPEGGTYGINEVVHLGLVRVISGGGDDFVLVRSGSSDVELGFSVWVYQAIHQLE
jgi:hypothetical protein